MLTESEQGILLKIAAGSIREGLAAGRALSVSAADYSGVLAEPGACFVTLHRHGDLRGCIGSLEAYEPLVVDTARNAFSAAFRDPRFPALQDSELASLDLEISVLGKPEPVSFTSQQGLVEQLEPGRDGLILEASGHRGTFLPSVWESLPEPRRFLDHLKMKAGLPADYWSDQVHIQRYHTQAFHTPFAEA